MNIRDIISDRGDVVGYNFSNTYLILEAASKQKFININYLNNMTSLERDKNFNKKYEKNLTKIRSNIQKVAIHTHKLAALQTMFSILQVHKFVPINFMSYIYDMEGIAYSNLVLYDDILTGRFFIRLGSVLADDLLAEIDVGGLNLSDLSNIAMSLSKEFPNQESLKNPLIRRILSLPLSTVFGYDNIVGFLEMASYIDYLGALFGVDPVRFNRSIQDKFRDNSSKHVINYPNVRNGIEPEITLGDPVGIGSERLVIDSVIKDYNVDVVDIAEEMQGEFGLTEEQTQELKDILTGYSRDMINEEFDNNNLLPSFFTISKALTTNVFNFTMDIVNQSIDSVGRIYIKRLNLQDKTVNTNDRPIDYLFNLKRNLDYRERARTSGRSNTDITSINSILLEDFGITNFDEVYLDELHKELVGLYDR